MPTDSHSLVAAYALDSLDEGEERDFEAHLADCERCRDDLAGLREAAAMLAYGADPDARDKRGVPVHASARDPEVRALLDEHRRTGRGAKGKPS